MSCEVIAHRGASGTAPENTLAAFIEAARLGAHMIELDVQLSADGHVVVMHDETVERTTDGCGPVSGFRLADLQQLDAGGWFDAAFRGERVPTLAEVLAAVSIPINVELKSCGGEALAEAVVDTVRSANGMDRVVFSSFEDEALARLRRIEPSSSLAVLRARGTIGHAVDAAERVGATALHLRNTSGWARSLRDTLPRGYTIRIWTVNSIGEWTRFESVGATGLFTDHPERFLHFSPA